MTHTGQPMADPARPSAGPPSTAGTSSSPLASASRTSYRHLPGRRLDSSEPTGWVYPLLEVIAQPATAELFTTQATPDLLVVTALRGRLQIESRFHGRWQSAPLHPGAVSLTAPGQADTLRWRMPDEEQRTTLHVHLPADLLNATRADLNATSRPEDLNVLGVHDPVAAAILDALHAAMRNRTESLVAESLAQALAAQLLTPSPRGDVTGTGGGRPKLSARALKRVTDYMAEHLTDAIGLDDLAREAHLSKFHFLRAFKETVGTTPHRYLTTLRMERAAELLVTQRHTVSAVASMCGYASAARFTTVFRERYGLTPGAYQRR